MSLDEQFEQMLPGAMRGAADEFPAPSVDLVQRATARGRRQVKVRVVQMTTAAVALAVVATGGALVGVGTLGGGDGGPPAQAGPAATGQDANVPYHKAGPPVTAQQMIATLTGLLPKGGHVTRTAGQGTAQVPGWLQALADYTTPKGTSGLDVNLYRLSPYLSRGQQGYGHCPSIESAPYTRCTARPLPDGSLLTVSTGPSAPTEKSGPQKWMVDLTTRDGREIVLNETAGGNGVVTGDPGEPVLSTGQLTTIASSPAWAKASDAIPTPPKRPRDPRSAMDRGVPTGSQISALITASLPGGGKLADWDVSDGYVLATYDDGKGRSLVSVQTQSGMYTDVTSLMSCHGEDADCKVSTLGDGTKIKEYTDREPGDSVEAYTVDVLHPDGHRIIATSANSYSTFGPVTRPHPAIQKDVLKSMALSPKLRWTK